MQSAPGRAVRAAEFTGPYALYICRPPLSVISIAAERSRAIGAIVSEGFRLREQQLGIGTWAGDDVTLMLVQTIAPAARDPSTPVGMTEQEVGAEAR